MPKRIAVAMSGGVDSSIAATMLKEQGYEIFGLTMRHTHSANHEGKPHATIKAEKDIDQARGICKRLGVKHHVVDIAEDFRRLVIRPFIDEYVKGRTPSPCIVCNERVKFGKLLDIAENLGADAIATGHYARIVKNETTGQMNLLAAVDRGKDQSYFLHRLKAQALAKTHFPLGALEKSQVIDFAKELGYPNAEKKESQDVCFLPDGDYAALVGRDERLSEVNRGEVVHIEAGVIGEHEGYYRYTVGQRRGLGVPYKEKIFVLGNDPEANVVFVGDKGALQKREMLVRNLSLVSDDSLADMSRFHCKIRSRHQATPATIHKLENRPLVNGEAARVLFDAPEEAITPGQAAVFYDGKRVVGGAWIEKAL